MAFWSKQIVQVCLKGSLGGKNGNILVFDSIGKNGLLKQLVDVSKKGGLSTLPRKRWSGSLALR